MIISKIYKEYRDWLKIVALVLIFVISGVIYYFSYNNKKLSIDEAAEISQRVGGNIEEYDTENNEGHWNYIDKYETELNGDTGGLYNCIEGETGSPEGFYEFEGKSIFRIVVWARNEEHAVKIARDKLAEEKAKSTLI
jgi:hypothetical protein